MTQPINILIVDDELKNLTVLETILDDPGYRLVRAESADKALLALVAEDFALLILDIRMPGMTGIELAQVIKEREKTALVPIIFLTAYYNEDQHILDGYGVGAVDYLQKPVNPTILRSKVAVFAELHRRQREVAIANRALLAEAAERRRAEEQLRELNETLATANQELEGFSYSISHDLRAPLRAVNSFVKMLQQGYGDRLDAEGHRLIGVVASEALRMGRLIDDLLAFSHLGRQQVRCSAIDMTALARGEFERLVSEPPGGRTIPDLKPEGHAPPRLDIKPLPPTQGDLAMLRQVFVNLLDNAVKFTSRQVAPVIEVGATSDAAGTTYYVKDNGVGFDEKYLSKLFGVFQRLHSNNDFEGTGVGLALVQRIIHRHGGKIWAEGKPGAGATFYFTLPTTRTREL